MSLVLIAAGAAFSISQPVTAQSCHPSYVGACVPANVRDVDCASGSGNGPYYLNVRVKVVGPDTYGLDRDKNGIGCEREPAPKLG